MDLYFFDRPTYDRLYNCSVLPQQEWEKRKERHLFGSLYLAMATIYQTVYIFFLIVMLKKEFWVHSWYKIMFWLGVYDTLATFHGGTILGIVDLRGDIFCTNKDFIYLSSCFCGTYWTAACVTSLLLMVNRILDLLNKDYVNKVFGGNKINFWLVIPFLYGLYFLVFTKPFLYNSKLESLFLNPWVTEPDVNKLFDPKDYANDPLSYHNLSVAVIFPMFYIILCVVLIRKSKSGHSNISKIEKQIVGQSVIISVFLVITAVGFIYMQYFYVPAWMIIFSHFTWQACHGASVFTYIVINKQLRKEAFFLFKKFITGGRWGNANRMAPQNCMTSYPTSYVPQGVNRLLPPRPNAPCDIKDELQVAKF